MDDALAVLVFAYNEKPCNYRNYKVGCLPNLNKDVKVNCCLFCVHLVNCNVDFPDLASHNCLSANKQWMNCAVNTSRRWVIWE